MPADASPCPHCEAMRERMRAFVAAKAKQERHLCDNDGVRWELISARENAHHWISEAQTWRQRALRAEHGMAQAEARAQIAEFAAMPCTPQPDRAKACQQRADAILKIWDRNASARALAEQEQRGVK